MNTPPIVQWLSLAPVAATMSVAHVADAKRSAVASARSDPSLFEGVGRSAAAEPMRLLFIHHSVGGQLLAPQGPEVGEDGIYRFARTGGNLRARLIAAGYEVHEASYNSRVGQDTDLFDWLPKFRSLMPEILRVDHQDRLYQDGGCNQILVFKSCYPNNLFVDEGKPPGRAEGPELTVWNAKATLMALLPLFAAHPDRLFIYVTAPPTAPVVETGSIWREDLKTLLGWPSRLERRERSGDLARVFNHWVAAPDGWLADYALSNVAVFDYYDLLTGQGSSNLAVYPTGDGMDAHPSLEGQRLAAAAFLPFLSLAVQRAGLIAQPTSLAPDA